MKISLKFGCSFAVQLIYRYILLAPNENLTLNRLLIGCLIGTSVHSHIGTFTNRNVSAEYKSHSKSAVHWLFHWYIGTLVHLPTATVAPNEIHTQNRLFIGCLIGTSVHSHIGTSTSAAADTLAHQLPGNPIPIIKKR